MRVITMSQEELAAQKETDANDELRIRFIRNMKYCDLYARNAHELQAWMKAFSTVMIRTDFHERFKVKKVIGQGSFAKVYSCTRADDGQEFAVKAFSKAALMKQEKGKAALKNELELLMELHHPNVMEIAEMHETKNSLYLVCQLFKGNSLNEYLKKSEEFLSHDSILAIIYGILNGLVYLEEKLILHRDLKPENIMLLVNCPTTSPEFCPDNFKICDFGLATRSDAKSYLYKRCGTPGYVAPEIVKSSSEDNSFRPTHKCDVFSVGVMLYLFLTGSTPFHSEDVKQILVKSAECKPDYANKNLAKVPAKIIELMKGLLAAEPSRRLSSREAISLPVFERFWPTGKQPFDTNIAIKSQLSYDIDTDVRDCDEGLDTPSVKSLEKRSICMKKPVISVDCSQSIKADSVGSPTFSLKSPIQKSDLHRNCLLKLTPSSQPEEYNKEFGKTIGGGASLVKPINCQRSDSPDSDDLKNGINSPSNPKARKFNFLSNEKQSSLNPKDQVHQPNDSNKKSSHFVIKPISRNTDNELLD